MAYAAFNISLNFRDRFFIQSGFWIKPLHPRFNISAACPLMLQPLASIGQRCDCPAAGVTGKEAEWGFWLDT